MRTMSEGDTFQVQGSGKNPYTIRMIGGVIDCSCPAWRNMGGNIDSRVCKHIKANVRPSSWPAAALAREGMAVGHPPHGTPVLPIKGAAVQTAPVAPVAPVGQAGPGEPAGPAGPAGP